jgi:hypothetical protein
MQTQVSSLAQTSSGLAKVVSEACGSTLLAVLKHHITQFPLDGRLMQQVMVFGQFITTTGDVNINGHVASSVLTLLQLKTSWCRSSTNNTEQARIQR